jgi:GGDEF domain-containing protein
MLLMLIVAIANIALGFYTTLVFRRDRVLLLAHATNSYVEDPEAGELPSESVASEPVALDPEPTVDDAELPPVEPARQPPLEELFYLAARLVDDLAQIDHSVMENSVMENSVMENDAPQQATETKLADMWPALAAQASPIEQLLQELAATEADQPSEHSQPAMYEAGLATVKHCRALTDQMATTAKIDDNSIRGMQLLRDLFSKACEFRNLCEDQFVEELAIDHRLVAAGRVALKQMIEDVTSEQPATEFGSMSLEVEQLSELNSMHGAAVVNALLDELAKLFAQQLPDNKLICRYHGQKYVVLLPGELEYIANLADQLRQQIGQTEFRFEEQALAVSLAVVVVPLSVAQPDLIGQFAAAKAGATEQGFNGVVVDCGEHLEVNAPASHELTPAEVVLHV